MRCSGHRRRGRCLWIATLIWIGGWLLWILRLLWIAGRRGRTLAYRVGCLLLLIWCHGHSLDGVEVSALILPAVDIGFHGHTLAGGETVKLSHLVAGELDEYKIGIGVAVLSPSVIEYQFSLLETLTAIPGWNVNHRRDVVNEGGC